MKRKAAAAPAAVREGKPPDHPTTRVAGRAITREGPDLTGKGARTAGKGAWVGGQGRRPRGSPAWARLWARVGEQRGKALLPEEPGHDGVIDVRL